MALPEASGIWFRRTVAIGVWLSLLGLIFLSPADVSIWGAIGILLSVSISSAISLLALCSDRAGEQTEQLRVGSVIFVISILVPIAWALRLAMDASLFELPALCLLAVFPQFALLQRISQSRLTVERQAPAIPVEESEESAEREPEAIVSPFLQLVHDDENHEQDAQSTPPENVTQWWQRSITASGDVIEGRVRVDFDEGQREATVHISFCPPFESLPEVLTEDLDDGDLDVRVAAVFRFGTRIIVRRPSNSNVGGKLLSEACWIGFVVGSAPTQGVA